MTTHTFRTLTLMGIIILIVVVWITNPGDVRGGPLYRCIDKDGDVIITDHPLPEFKTIPGHPAEMTEEQRELLEKQEKEIEMDVYKQVIDGAKKDKQARLNDAREELARAKEDQENYRMHIEQTTDLDKRVYWREMYDKQQKVVEEKQRRLQELESEQ
ncbi:MAG: hypothetical protein ABFD82_21525 [Syntrophaceae bacterium]